MAIRRSLAVAVLAALVNSALVAEDLKQGAAFEIDGAKAKLTALDSLPFADDEYTRRFKFDSFENPKLKELREHYRLDEIVAGGNDEFDKQVRLNDWTHNQFKKFGKPSINAKGAVEILDAIDKGHTFFCAQYARTLVSAAASLGWVDRIL